MGVINKYDDSYKGSGVRKYSYEYVKYVFEKNGCVLLSDRYINSKSKLKYICECGNEHEMAFGRFYKGSRCKVCQINKKKLSYSYIKKQFEKRGYTLLSKEYVNNSTLLKYRCFCGNETDITYGSLSRGHGCSRCAGNEKLEYSEVAKLFEDKGCKLLSETYEGIGVKLDYLCVCGREDSRLYWDFKLGRSCKMCAIESRSGKHHYAYRHDLTDEERIEKRLNPENRQWRNDVLIRDDYVCKKCGVRGGDLQVHHIYAYANYPKLRTDIDNGVTLCVACHKDFHDTYGRRGDNTRKEYEEWMNIDEIRIA